MYAYQGRKGTPLIGVVPVGYESNTNKLTEIKIPTEVTTENLVQTYEDLLFERPLGQVNNDDTNNTEVNHLNQWKKAS